MKPSLVRSDPPAPVAQPLTFQIGLDDGDRQAVLVLPADVTDSELLGVVGVIVGQVRITAAGQRAQQLVIARAPLARV